MQIQVFSIPTYSNQVQLEEMNRFLRGRHVPFDFSRKISTSSQSFD